MGGLLRRQPEVLEDGLWPGPDLAASCGRALGALKKPPSLAICKLYVALHP